MSCSLRFYLGCASTMTLTTCTVLYDAANINAVLDIVNITR